jgi:hypothetical protein
MSADFPAMLSASLAVVWVTSVLESVDTKACQCFSSMISYTGSGGGASMSGHFCLMG